MGIVNWRILEKMTGWAVSTGDEEVAYWDTWAEGWDKRMEFEKEFTQRQVDALKLSAEDTVLDACCGTGRLTIPMAKRAKQVTGLDSGADMLERCRQNAQKEGLTNVSIIQVSNWHRVTPGVDFPKHDIVVACISPAQADIVKLSSAATKYCYSLSFSKPIAYRHVLADLFAGATSEWLDNLEEKMKELSNTSHDIRELGMNVPFNILYDLGANPTVNYVDGGWEYEADTKEEVYAFLSNLGEVLPGKEEIFRNNVNKKLHLMPNGRYRYITRTQMYVLGWDPNELQL